MRSYYKDREAVTDEDLYKKVSSNLSGCKDGTICAIVKLYKTSKHFSTMQRAMLLYYLDMEK